MQPIRVWAITFAVASAFALSGSTRIEFAPTAALDTSLPFQAGAKPAPDTAIPDFSAYRSIAERKRAFYDYMLPKIRTANAEVRLERRWLLDVAGGLVRGSELSNVQLERLAAMEHHYGVASEGDAVQRVGRMLRHVDVVPASLILAQAAKESGWGTSRFAVEGNNFFGIWCFNNGCGIRPLRRDPGRIHEVATFDSVMAGVRYYIRTLNSQPAYQKLRKIRAEARRQNQLAPGDELAQGLLRYSERGLLYVREIQSMIRYNNLHRFTLFHQEA